MKLLRSLVLGLLPLFIIYYSLFIAPSAARAQVDPNVSEPDRAYYLDQFFPLFRFINPKMLKVFENQDELRKYPDIEVCAGGGPENPQYDHRDYLCDNVGDGCDGGDVEMCDRGTTNYARTMSSAARNWPQGCSVRRVNERTPAGTEGTCSYTSRASNNRDIKGTDFSNRLLDGLTFPKYQNEWFAYDFTPNINPENVITHGSHNLSLSLCDQAINKAKVAFQAKQTKSTVNQTGEWPLGWVDWNYKTSNGKALIEIHDALPDITSTSAKVIVEAKDSWYMTAGGNEVDVSYEKQALCSEVSAALSLNPPPTWVTDLMQAPNYPPSVKKGYAHSSICIWHLCCPGDFACPPGISDAGSANALYGDSSIHGAFAAAMDDLFLHFSLEDASEFFRRRLAQVNPLTRFALVAGPKAIPSEINSRLMDELGENTVSCDGSEPKKYVQGLPNPLKINKLGHIFDHQNLMDNWCYKLQPDVVKESALSYDGLNLLQMIINLIWPVPTDDVDMVTRHLLTIPDPMGQSIATLQEAIYDTRDTLAELEAEKADDYPLKLSNTVQTEADPLKAGKPYGPGETRRRFAYFSCSDDMYSSPHATSVEAYVLGTHIGCFDTTAVPEGKCDGQLFGQLIAGSKYADSSPKSQAYFDANIKARLTPELMNTYAAAEKETGVPCEILAGIHAVEADNNPQGSLVSGRPIGGSEPDAGGAVFRSLLETAVYAGNHLKGKVGGNLGSVETTITALSRYNGGGNSNCQAGYPYPIPYSGCPRAFEGEDDPYPVNWVDSKHDTMYLLYCADGVACAPQIWERPGAFTVALNVYNSLTKSGYENTDLPPEQPDTPLPPTTPTGPGTPTGYFPQSCGTNSLSTALGCLPYERAAFISTLLRFLIGIAGGIALVIMFIGVIQIMTAAGDEKKLQSGRDLFFAAVAGLLFLIFSVSLLRLFAADILQIPGF